MLVDMLEQTFEATLGAWVLGSTLSPFVLGSSCAHIVAVVVLVVSVVLPEPCKKWWRCRSKCVGSGNMIWRWG